MQKIVPFLWFDNQAEEAINFYISIFDDAKVVNVVRTAPDGPLFTATFQLEGQEFYVINGGPMFHFTEAISLFVKCTTQKEVDDKWGKLAEGGIEKQCGWLQDRYGLSWQIIPEALGRLLGDKDPEKARRVTEAMLKMKKIDIRALEDAYNNQG